MQIQVGFSFQEKAWEKLSQHIQSHLLKQNAVTDIDTESLPLPGLQFNRLLRLLGSIKGVYSEYIPGQVAQSLGFKDD